MVKQFSLKTLLSVYRPVDNLIKFSPIAGSFHVGNSQALPNQTLNQFKDKVNFASVKKTWLLLVSTYMSFHL
jgi:hypothetical protein